MQRYALGVEYDGRTWSGWQSQPSGKTVQDALERALSQFADETLRIHAAGRTDTGVHATAQVIHFDTSAKRALSGWIRGVNRYLPSSVAVRWACEVPSNFHARFSATARAYCYVLYCSPTRAPLYHGRAGWQFRALELNAMQEAAVFLEGEHDFSAFRSAECQASSPVRTVHALHIVKRQDLFVFQIHANAFLHHMVRNVVGSLIDVGRGAHPVSWMHDVLVSRNRTEAAPTFMPDGLYLTRVDYPASFELPASAGLEAAFPGLLP